MPEPFRLVKASRILVFGVHPKLNQIRSRSGALTQHATEQRASVPSPPRSFRNSERDDIPPTVPNRLVMSSAGYPEPWCQPEWTRPERVPSQLTPILGEPRRQQGTSRQVADPSATVPGMDTIREAPRAATFYMLAGALQFAPVILRFAFPELASNGWLLTLAILLISAALYGLATLLQRLLMPERRTAFSLGVLWAGIAVSLINSLYWYTTD